MKKLTRRVLGALSHALSHLKSFSPKQPTPEVGMDIPSYMQKLYASTQSLVKGWRGRELSLGELTPQGFSLKRTSIDKSASDPIVIQFRSPDPAVEAVSIDIIKSPEDSNGMSVFAAPLVVAKRFIGHLCHTKMGDADRYSLFTSLLEIERVALKSPQKKPVNPFTNLDVTEGM